MDMDHCAECDLISQDIGFDVLNDLAEPWEQSDWDPHGATSTTLRPATSVCLCSACSEDTGQSKRPKHARTYSCTQPHTTHDTLSGLVAIISPHSN